MNLNGLSPANVAEASALGAKWVRVFVPWPDLEPSPGVHSAFWLGQYDRLLGALPKGAHAILDFVDTPFLGERLSGAQRSAEQPRRLRRHPPLHRPALGRESGGV